MSRVTECLILKETSQETIKIDGQNLKKLVLIEIINENPISLTNCTKLRELELWDTRYFHHEVLSNIEKLSYFEGDSAKHIEEKKRFPWIELVQPLPKLRDLTMI